MIYCFIFSTLILIFFEYKIYKRIINPLNLLTIPYLFIIVINNFYAVKKGFYYVTNETLTILMLGFFSFFIGTILGSNHIKIRSKEYVKKEIASFKESANYSAIFQYMLIVLIIEIVRIVIIIIKNGILFFASKSGEGYILTGPLGHLLLTTYPLIPMTMYYWKNNKSSIRYLVVCIMLLFVYFLTFVKYHSMSIVVVCFIYYLYREGRSNLRILIVFIGLILLLFVYNYVISFIEIGNLNKIGNDYYLNHMWMYSAGSIIHAGSIFKYGINQEWSFFYKIGRLFFALPNMFINRFFNFRLFNSIESTLTFSYVSDTEIGNTIDFISYLFPSVPNTKEIILFICFLIFLGYIFTKMNNAANKYHNNYSIIISTFVALTFVCFLSFFGVYAGLIPPWEVYIYSLIIPNLFTVHEK